MIEELAGKLAVKGLGGLASLVIGKKGKKTVKKIMDFLGVKDEKEILSKIENPEVVKALKELEMKEVELAIKSIEQQSGNIQTEIKSESWLAKNWRPIIMLLFGVIIANNYIVYPYLSLIFKDAPKMIIPPDMWQLLKLGLSGYVVGRSLEKIVKNFRG